MNKATARNGNDRRPSIVYEEDIPVNVRRGSVTMTLRITENSSEEPAVTPSRSGGLLYLPLA